MMTDKYGIPLPTPLVVIGLIFTAAVAIGTVVFSKQLRQIPDYMETVIHETGHALSGVPLNGGMPTKIDFFDGAEAQVEYMDYGSGFIGRWFSTISGYGFPILFGFALIWLTFTPTVYTVIPLLVCGVVFCLQILIGRFFFAFRFIFTLVFHGSLIWLLFYPQSYMDLPVGTITGLQAQQAMFGFVCFALLLGSWRHLFSIGRAESNRTFIILGVLFAILTVFYLFPGLTVVKGFLFFGLGVFVLVGGIRTVLITRSSGWDYEIMAHELGGTPLSHFITFVMLFPVALFLVFLLLMRITLPEIAVQLF